jgi:hypothetical protein
VLAVDTIVTYLPFHRVHEVLYYFIKNAELICAKNRVVYVDNVFSDRQLDLLKKIVPEDIEVRCGNWRDRSLTLMRVLRDGREEGWDALLVDSDNMLDPRLAKFDGILVSKHGYYSVLDYENGGGSFLNRSVSLGLVKVDGDEAEVYGYRIPGVWRGIFFIGPKQAVRLSRSLLESLDMPMVEKIEESLKSIEYGIRYYISDETTLGILLYYSGIKIMPWLVMSHHMCHSSTSVKDFRTLKMLAATAHAQLGRNLLSKKPKRRILWYYTRYKMAQLYNLLANYVTR